MSDTESGGVKRNRMTVEKWAIAKGLDVEKVMSLPSYERATILPLSRSADSVHELTAKVESLGRELAECKELLDRAHEAGEKLSTLIGRLKN